LKAQELVIVKDSPKTTTKKANKLDKLNVSENIIQARIAAVNGVNKKTRDTNPDESFLRLYKSIP
jgi:hypothetical protein